MMWLSSAFAQKPSSPTPAAKADEALKPASKADLAVLKTLDQKYQATSSVSMSVEKSIKLGLLGGERKSKGTLILSKGRLRLETEGDEKSLLVINKKNFWAVTFPDADFKDAPVQVITGATDSKKGRSQTMVGLLTQGGFLKFFKATGVQAGANGEKVYFLQPEKQQTDFKRAQLTISADGKEIRGLRYWDERDNETRLVFTGIAFGKKVDEKQFSFAPPANAEIMKM